MADVIYAMKNYGMDIEIVDPERFAAAVSEAAKNDDMSETVLGLVAYETGNEQAAVPLNSSNRVTVNLLYKLGFKWPITDDSYLANAIKALDTLGFFG